MILGHFLATDFPAMFSFTVIKDTVILLEALG